MSEENSNEEKTKVLNALFKTGCCKRCIRRYLGDHNTNFDNPEDVNQKDNDEQTLKKIKLSPCVVCLDLLQDSTLESMILSSELLKVAEYDCDTFINYISYPIAVIVREHAMLVYLKNEFPEFFKDSYIIPINKAWSQSIKRKLAERIKKRYDKDSDFNIQFTTTYQLEKDESSVILNFMKKIKKDEVLGRNVVVEILKTVDSKLFQEHVIVPPQTSDKTVELSEVTFKHKPIFIAGRYSKYSRTLGQSPWVVDNVRIAENSVQEVIFKSLNNTFNCKNFVFSSSGREDFDVRTLGRGRPFFIKIEDPKITNIPLETFRSIEATIKKTNLVQVRHLQIIDQKCLANIKEGEQFKQKTYRALCIINNPENLEGYIEKINGIEKLTLQQKTPIRVYHRRSSDVRERVIYGIKAKPIKGKDKLFELDVITQAGTYVKEFVHGDFGRTKPSLGEIIGGHVDIVALDVLDIDLDFPPPIDYKSLKKAQHS